MKYSLRRISCIAGLLSFFFSAVSVHALTITPVRIEIKGDPGTTLTEEMTLINEQDATITYYSSYANFEAQGDTGSPAFVNPTEGLGTWMKTADSITLGPKESKTISIAITIPSSTTPGGYFGAIFWGTAPESTTPGEVAISAKTGMLVLLSVNGEVKEAGGLVDFQTKEKAFWYNTLPVSFEYRFRNDGGDRVKPSGLIKIRNMVYLPSDKIDANPVQGNVLPNSTRKFTTDWIKHPESDDAPLATSAMGKFFHKVGYQWRNFAVGLYFAKIDIAYGSQGQRATDTVKFFVFPWQLLIVIVLVLFVLWKGGKKLLRAYNRFIISKARAGTAESFDE